MPICQVPSEEALRDPGTHRDYKLIVRVPTKDSIGIDIRSKFEIYNLGCSKDFTQITRV